MLGPIGANLQNIQKVKAGEKPEEAKKAHVNNVTKLRAVSDQGVSLDEAVAYKIESSSDQEQEKEEDAHFREALYDPSDYQAELEKNEEMNSHEEYRDLPKLWLVKDINKFTPDEAIEIYKDIQAMGPIKVAYDEDDEPMVSNGSAGVLINKKQY